MFDCCFESFWCWSVLKSFWWSFLYLSWFCNIFKSNTIVKCYKEQKIVLFSSFELFINNFKIIFFSSLAVRVIFLFEILKKNRWKMLVGCTLHVQKLQKPIFRKKRNSGDTCERTAEDEIINILFLFFFFFFCSCLSIIYLVSLDGNAFVD